MKTLRGYYSSALRESADISFEKTFNEFTILREFLKEWKGKLSDKTAEDLAQKIDEKICVFLSLS
jgi:hypothetical protein